MIVDKNKVMRCSRYASVSGIHVRLNGELLVEVECFKYLGPQVSADRGCARNMVQR